MMPRPCDHAPVAVRCLWPLAGLTLLPLIAACTGGPGSARPQGGSSSLEATTNSSTSAGVELHMRVPRAVHRATVLPGGRVLITGGCTQSGCEGFDGGQRIEIIDAVARTSTLGPAMATPRAGHTATRLSDGRVLLVGGYPEEGQAPLATAEVYDPVANTFASAGRLSVPRADHSATLLPDGRVLIVGGTDGSGTLATTELFIPDSGRFVAGPPMSSGRAGHAAVEIAGRIVVVGGTANLSAALTTTQVLRGGQWSSGPRLRIARVKHAAVSLPDGRILVVGGSPNAEGREALASTEVMDRSFRLIHDGPELSEPQYKLDGAVMSLADGRVVIAGGQQVNVFDPTTDRVAVIPAPPVPRRSFVSASVVTDDLVLIAGGYDSAITPTAAVRFVEIPAGRN